MSFSGTPLKIFVTVGSTRFDALVRVVCGKAFLRDAGCLGVDLITVQRGASPLPSPEDGDGLGRYERDCEDDAAAALAEGRARIEVFEFDPTGADRYIQAADVIVCHAGAGTLLECLNYHKRVISVANAQLLDDHQRQLAQTLRVGGYIYAVESPDSLLPTLRECLSTSCGGGSSLRPFPDPDASRFHDVLAGLIGVNLQRASAASTR
eukprot:GHVU01020340.1.p1 GENE.GHVU01020340.1~~GHVU01020340.1.p1  ORF type:complete len:208 (+),score=25.09 GHVU01020340.1:252-875(+)